MDKQDSEMIGEQSQFYDIDHLLCRKSQFASEDFEPSVEVSKLHIHKVTQS